MKPDDQFSERLTDWEPKLAAGAVAESYRCVRCRDGEKPCVQGNPNWCDWRGAAIDYLPDRRRTSPALPHAEDFECPDCRKKLAALIAATEAAVERLWAYPEDEWSAVTRTTLRAAIYAARKE